MKVTRLFLSLIACLCAHLALYGQSGGGLRFIGGDTTCRDAYFSGEFHNITALPAFKAAYTEYLYYNCGVTAVVVEYGRGYAYLSNRYLETGDTTLFPSVSRLHNSMLKRLRAINLKNAGKPQIRIYGIDFERISFVKALLHVFAHNANPQCRATKLYAGLTAITAAEYQYLDTTAIFKKKVRKGVMAHYAAAQAVFNSEKEVLRTTLGNDYHIVEEILTNPSTGKFKTRDRNMAINLGAVAREQGRFVCFLGKAHTNLLHTNPVVSRYVAAYGAARTSLVTLATPTRSISEMYMGMPRTARENEDNRGILQGLHRSDADRFHLVHASRLEDISEQDTKGVNSWFMYFDE